MFMIIWALINLLRLKLLYISQNNLFQFCVFGYTDHPSSMRISEEGIKMTAKMQEVQGDTPVEKGW